MTGGLRTPQREAKDFFDKCTPQSGLSRLLGMHRYHFFTNRYDNRYFYLCTCRYRVPIPILSRFGLYERSAINLKAVFISSSEDYVKPLVRLYKMNRRLFQAKDKQSFLV